MRKISIISCLLLIIAAATVEGQIVFNRPPSGSPQFVYSHWKLSSGDIETTADQSYFPLRAFIPIRDNLEAHVLLAGSSNSVEFAELESSASGFGDARIQINQSLQDDHILTKLDIIDEWPIIPVLSQDYLEFPSRRLGEGFGFNLLMGGATTWGEARVGGGVAYRFLGEYQPYDGSGDYNSGDMFSINAGIDLPKRKTRWAASAVYTIYGADKLDGQKTFKQSPQLVLSGSGTYTADPHSVTVWLTYAMRGDNTFYDSTEAVIDESKLYGNEFAFGARAQYEFAEDWQFMPSVKVRLISANDYLLGAADIYSFGAAVGRQFSEQFSANAGFRYFTGSIDGGLIDLTGYQISVGLMINF